MTCRKVTLKTNMIPRKPPRLPPLDENINNTRGSTRFQLSKHVDARMNQLKVTCETPLPLSTKDIAKFRQSKFQTVLNEMLMKGYHRSFSILFNINKEREKKRLEEGPDSTRWKLTSLTLHPNLDQIKDNLCMIEESTRNGDYNNIMISTNILSTIFGKNPEDSWIVNQFVTIEMECSTNVIYDSGYLKAIANLNAGILAAKCDNLQQAAEYLARVFSMSYSHNWKDQNGDSLSRVCSEHLCQVYLRLACENSNSKPVQMLSYLKQAHEISKETSLKTIEATCCLELGKIFEKLKNIDMAIAYFRGLFEVARSINDQSNLGLACEAMGRCYEKQNNKVEAMRYLEKFVHITEQSCEWQEYARACRVLGETFNRYGEHVKAKVAFQNSYQVTYCLKSTESFNESRLLTGVAEGCGINSKIKDHIGINNREALARLITFKSNTLDVDSAIFFERITEKDEVTFNQRIQNNKR